MIWNTARGKTILHVSEAFAVEDVLQEKTIRESPNWYEHYFGPDYLIIDHQHKTSLEVDFILGALKLDAGTKLLDIACGYGRHLVPLAERGIDVIGCDRSPFMLQEAQKSLQAVRRKGKEIGAQNRLVRCDMRELPFTRFFDCACNMFNSFGYFSDEDDNYRALSAVAQALKPGGLFLLDLENRDLLLRSMTTKDWFESGDAVILEEKKFDFHRNRTEIDVRLIDKKGGRSYHHSIRVYSFSEISMLLNAAGFMVRAVFGGFNAEDFDWDHDRMLIISQVDDKEDE